MDHSEAVIMSLEPQVKAQALRVRRTVPRAVELDDLIQAGWTGALEAAGRWNPDRNVSLAAFCEIRIKGAMQDYLRSIDPLTRDHRKAVRSGKEMAPVSISLDADADGLKLQIEDKSCRIQQSIDNSIDIERRLNRRCGKPLTPREIQVLRLSALGKYVKEIAAELGIKPKTADAHRRNLCLKTGAHGARSLTLLAIQRGVVTLQECFSEV